MPAIGRVFRILSVLDPSLAFRMTTQGLDPERVQEDETGLDDNTIVRS